MDRLHLIEVFVAVVEVGGLAGAARKLAISPPAVTRAVNELESRLGVRLLTRTTRVVRVTEAGQRYAEDARRILAALDEADASAAGLHGEARGRLTVTAPVMFGTQYVTPIVTDYLRRHPQASASCWFVDRVVNLIEEGVDVALRIGELPDSSLQAVRVGQVRRVICAAPAYLAEHGHPRHPDELAGHCIVSASAVTPTAEWTLRVDGASHTLRLAPRLVVTGNEAARAAVQAGFGLTRLLSYQVADALRDGSLVAVLEDHEPAPLPVQLLHREGRHVARKVRAFLDLAIESMRANPALQAVRA